MRAAGLGQPAVTRRVRHWPHPSALPLHSLRPDRVTVLTDEDGWPSGLEYREGRSKRTLALGAAGACEPEAAEVGAFDVVIEAAGSARALPLAAVASRATIIAEYFIALSLVDKPPAGARHRSAAVGYDQ